MAWGIVPSASVADWQSVLLRSQETHCPAVRSIFRRSDTVLRTPGGIPRYARHPMMTEDITVVTTWFKSTVGMLPCFTAKTRSEAGGLL